MSCNGNYYPSSPLYQLRTEQPILTLDHYRSLIASGKVVVFFTASWCGPCKKIKQNLWPELRNVYGQVSSIAFVMIDVDKNPEIAEAEGVNALPTFKFYTNGRKAYHDVCGGNETLIKNGTQALYQYEFRKVEPVPRAYLGN